MLSSGSTAPDHLPTPPWTPDPKRTRLGASSARGPPPTRGLSLPGAPSARPGESAPRSHPAAERDKTRPPRPAQRGKEVLGRVYQALALLIFLKCEHKTVTTSRRNFIDKGEKKKKEEETKQTPPVNLTEQHTGVLLAKNPHGNAGPVPGASLHGPEWNGCASGCPWSHGPASSPTVWGRGLTSPPQQLQRGRRVGSRGGGLGKRRVSFFRGRWDLAMRSGRKRIQAEGTARLKALRRGGPWLQARKPGGCSGHGEWTWPGARRGEVGRGHPGADSWNFCALQLRV